jgi:hypothetical protein
MYDAIVVGARALSVRQRISCPVQRAFDLMADGRNEAAWNSHVSRSELLSEEPVGPGSPFLVVNRGQQLTGALSEYDRPRRVVFDVTSKQLDLTGSFTFRAQDDRTVLDAEFDFRPKGAMKLFFPLVAPLVRRDLPRQLASFAAFCERS